MADAAPTAQPSNRVNRRLAFVRWVRRTHTAGWAVRRPTFASNVRGLFLGRGAAVLAGSAIARRETHRWRLAGMVIFGVSVAVTAALAMSALQW